MSSFLSEKEQRDAMVRAAARKYRTTFDEIMSPSRAHLPTFARWYAWALIRHHFGDSYPKIGRRFGRDHASVMNGIARHFGYKRPSKNEARGTGLAIDIFLGLNAEQLTAEAVEALVDATERKQNMLATEQRKKEEAELAAIVASWPPKEPFRHAA